MKARLSVRQNFTIAAGFFIALLLAATAASGSARARGAAEPPPLITAKLASIYEIEARGSDASAAGLATTANEATAVARSAFEWAGGGLPSAALVEYTDPHYGTMISGIGGPVIPYYVDKLAWLVIIPHTTQTKSRPEHGRLATFTATLCVFVDAVTGKYLEAVTLSE